MKLLMERIACGEEEVVIRYRERSARIEAIAALVQETEPRICAADQEGQLLLRPEDIFYLESVDGATFAYLEQKVCRVSAGLGEMATRLAGRGFFRCSKSMVLNINKIRYLKSEPQNRILATLENGEQAMISRKYARQLRLILKGEAEDEA